MMKVKLKDPRPFVKNTLQGFLTLEIGPFEITDFTYHVQGEKSWLGFPSKSFTDKETGETRYIPMMKIVDDSRYKKFQNWARAEAKELFKNAAPPEPDPALENDEQMNDIPF
jgi:hypothetical protein